MTEAEAADGAIECQHCGKVVAEAHSCLNPQCEEDGKEYCWWCWTAFYQFFDSDYCVADRCVTLAYEELKKELDLLGKREMA